MPETEPDKTSRTGDAVLFVHALDGAAPGEEAIARLRDLGLPVHAHRALPACTATRHGLERLGPLLAELAESHPGKAVVLVHAALPLDPAALRAILRPLRESTAPEARTALSNADPDLNPFAGLNGAAPADALLAGAVDLLGEGVGHEYQAWPSHLVALSAAAAAHLARPEVTPAVALATLQAAGGTLMLSDRLFLHAPGTPLFSTRRLEPHESPRPPAWGGLSANLQAWLDAGAPDFGHDPKDRRPATLHVTHSWGGGVALWTRTFIEHEDRTRHLQLRSEGPQSGQGHGQRLALYAGNRLDCPLAQWWLQPAIQSVEDAREAYRDVLQQVCARHGVGRIVVSSLVGHCLDALRTGLPTVQVMHDHFPAWPFLSANPLDYPGGDGRPDPRAALDDRRLAKEFPDLTVEKCHAIRDAHFAAITEHGVKLAAPVRSVLELQSVLDPRWADLDAELIPHGFPPFADAVPVTPRPRDDGRLRLVILGRIQGGKGRELLRQALPDLAGVAQVYLVGAGKSGEEFFGLDGVHVVTDYRRERLPELLANIGPDLAALLSIVPETFSYTLSELRSLHIPVIATRVGSFPGRIEHGSDGWLIEPRADALAGLVAELAEKRDGIARVRRNLEGIKAGDPASMVAAYRRLCPPAAAQPAPLATAGLWRSQAAALAFERTAERAARGRAERESGDLQKEVHKRTEWALDTQRALEAEQATLRETRADLDETRHKLDGAGAQLRQLSQDFEHLQRAHDQVLASSSWRITRPLRVLRRMVRNFVLARAWNPLRWPLLLSGLVRNLATLGPRGTLMRLQHGGYAPEPEPVPELPAIDAENPEPPGSVPRSARPEVSVVIPAYGNWAYTAACLKSISKARCLHGIEVILVDDASADETGEAAPAIEGLRYIRNAQNLGFIGTCNRGASEAASKYLVLLNNDTQVTDGWLDRLVEVFGRFPDAGLVGSRLVYPDGRLQECGGIVFEDGSAWNYGRNDNPSRPEYLCVREADYCSGAAIMLETALFRKLGGFDERYRPAYYEDTDLAMRVRAAGRKVYVQPASTVIHHEGVTSGTDTGSGIKRHQVDNREKFLQRWREELRAFPPRIEDATNPAAVRAARDHRVRGRVLVIDATTPEPDQDSGSLRLSHLMRCLRTLGYGVTFFADNHGHHGGYTRDLQQWGIEVLYEPWLESNHAFFRQRGAEFDYVLVSRHYVAANYVALVRKHCPNARFIFDTVDLHYLREQRLADLEDSLALRRVAAQTRRNELAVIAQADAVLVVSETEVGVLAEDAPGALVHVLSNIHEVPGRRVGYSGRKDLFFVGGYQHPPNVDAAKWFVTRIWPLIHAELPEAKFHLVGSKAPDSVRSLKGEGVAFQGFVEDLGPYLDRCRLAVAPLRYGAGVKGKVNMSMAHGQPVVATPMAIEGLHAEHGRDVLVAEEEQAFADEVVRLYRDEELWNRISEGAVRNVQEHFSVDAAARSIEDLFGRLERR